MVTLGAVLLVLIKILLALGVIMTVIAYLTLVEVVKRLSDRWLTAKAEVTAGLAIRPSPAGAPRRDP